MTLDSLGGGQTMQDLASNVFHPTGEIAELRKDSDLDQSQRNENKESWRVLRCTLEVRVAELNEGLNVRNEEKEGNEKNRADSQLE